jgi:hypothetical protein
LPRNVIWKEKAELAGFLSEGLILPAVVLGVAAFAVPRLLAHVMPEGVMPLLLNAFLSTVLLFVLSAVLFVGLYIWQGLPMVQIQRQGLVMNTLYFGRLGIAAAIIWAPILILSVAGLPRKWVNETW